MIRRTLCTFTLMLELGVMPPSVLAQDIVPEGGKLTKLFEASVLTEGVAVAGWYGLLQRYYLFTSVCR